MVFSSLIFRHPENEKYADYWILLEKLVAGGIEVDKDVKKELLVNPDKRSDKTIEKRIELAPYISFMGGIMTRLVSQLLQKPAEYLSEAKQNDPFWDEEFFPAGAIDQYGTNSFHKFLKDAIMNALAQQMAIAVIDTPFVIADNRQQQEQLGGNKPYVYLQKRENLWDWASDRNGFQFLKFHNFLVKRETWDSEPIPIHEFIIYQRKPDSSYTVQKFFIEPEDTKKYTQENFKLDQVREEEVKVTEVFPEREIYHVVEGSNRIFRPPVRFLKLHPSLWIADQLFDPQKSMFNQTSAGEWALYTTNYAQLIFNEVDDVKVLQDRLGLEGDGYYTALPPDITVSWLERDGQGIDRSRQSVSDRKDDMLQILSAIAYSASITSSAIRRSGESKKEDRRNLDILLEVYGQHIASFAKKVLDTASIARGTTDTWKVEGFNKYDSDSLIEDLNQFMESEWVTNSPTLKIESMKQLAVLAMKDLGVDSKIKEKVFEEIENNSYYLDEQRMNFLRSISDVGRLSPEGLLEVMKQAQILPQDFDIQQELNRQAIQSVNLAQLPENQILS